MDYVTGPQTDLAYGGHTLSYENAGFSLPTASGSNSLAVNLTNKSSSFCFLSGISGGISAGESQVGVWYQFPDTPDDDWIVVGYTAGLPINFSVECIEWPYGGITTDVQDLLVGGNSTFCPGEPTGPYHCAGSQSYPANICDIEGMQSWGSPNGDAWGIGSEIGFTNDFVMRGGQGTNVWSSCLEL